MKFRFNGMTAAALFGLLALVGAPRAYATAELRISDGTNSVDVFDNNSSACVAVGAVTGCTDANAGLNQVTYVGTIGTWTLNVSTGSSHGASVGTDLDLNSANSTTAASTLTILFSDSGFTSGAGGRTLSVGGTLQGAMSSVSFGAWEGATLFDTAPADRIGSILTFTTSPFAGTSGGPGAGADLTERAILTATGAGSTSFNFALAPVPEPASVMLFGGMLLATVGAIRRKARRA
jgi:hypothetical protein